MWRIVTGFLVGYYMGTKAGREKYVELQKALGTILTSQTFHDAVQGGAAKITELTNPATLKQARGLLVGRVVGLMDGLAQHKDSAGPKKPQ